MKILSVLWKCELAQSADKTSHKLTFVCAVMTNSDLLTVSLHFRSFSHKWHSATLKDRNKLSGWLLNFAYPAMVYNSVVARNTWLGSKTSRHNLCMQSKQH